jgi:hypothetical protein
LLISPIAIVNIPLYLFNQRPCQVFNKGAPTPAALQELVEEKARKVLVECKELKVIELLKKQATEEKEVKECAKAA